MRGVAGYCPPLRQGLSARSAGATETLAKAVGPEWWLRVGGVSFEPAAMPPIYDLIIDLPDGIGTRPVEASSGKEAFEIGLKLFPGCRLAGVVREESDQPDCGLDAEVE